MGEKGLQYVITDSWEAGTQNWTGNMMAEFKIPGLGLGPFGQWFTRHETWAEQSGPWMTYLARSCYMLQQGKFVADIIYFYGEDNNITALFGDKLPDVPEGYNYDFTNADALVNILGVTKGNITTRSGMTIKEVLDALSTAPDFTYSRPQDNTNFMFVHHSG